MDADVTELRGVVCRPSPVGAVAGGRRDGRRQHDRLGAGVDGDLADAARRVLPQGDDSGGSRPGRTRTLDHAQRRQRQHRRSRVVGEHAGVASRPARGQLWTVEEDGQHEGGADGAQQVGDGVEAGEVLAHHGDDRDPAAELEELDRPARHLHRLPPAQPRVQRGAEVVLQQLTLVERPAVVLVLAVVPPPTAEADAEVHPVARQPAGGRRRVTDARHQHADAVAVEHRLEVVDRAVGNGALGKHDDVDDVDLVSGRGQHSVDEIEVELLGRGELEEAERLAFDALYRWLLRAEVAGADAQRPRQQHEVERLPARIEPGTLRRDLVPHRIDARNGARRRSGRATASRCRRRV